MSMNKTCPISSFTSEGESEIITTRSLTSPDKVSRNADRRGDYPNRDQCAEAPVLAPELRRKCSVNVAHRRSLFPSRRNELQCARAFLHKRGRAERPSMRVPRQSLVGYA